MTGKLLVPKDYCLNKDYSDKGLCTAHDSTNILKIKGTDATGLYQKRNSMGKLHEIVEKSCAVFWAGHPPLGPTA